MSNHAEDVLFANLSDTDALETLVREGLDLKIIPTEAARPIVEWCIEQFFKSGRTRAPSVEAIKAEWRDQLADAEISLGDGTETDSMEFAIENLKEQHAHYQVQQFVKEFSRKMAEAAPPDRITVLDQHAASLLDLSLSLQRQANVTDSDDAINSRIKAYLERAETGHQTIGLTFGLDPIDAHTFGIHPGELAVLAAGPKIGKSWFCAHTALKEWRRGKNVVLYTLENTAEMTWDRLICMGAGISYRRWQRGECQPDEVQRVMLFEQTARSSKRLHVIMPDPGKRTVAAMVRGAEIRDVESLIIDQLTFIEPKSGKAARWEQIREVTHELKTLISTGRTQIPCMLAHQINREGVNAAKKSGMLEMQHLAEGSEVERTADWVFGLFQSKEDRNVTEATFQTLAARREDTKNWRLKWDVSSGNVHVMNELEFAV